MDTYHVSIIMLYTVGELFPLILTTNLWDRFYYIPCLIASLSVLLIDLQDLLFMLRKDDVLSIDINLLAEEK